MSKLRQTGDPDARVLVRSYAVTHPPDLHLPERAFAAWHQLAYAARGVMAVHAAGEMWVIPPQRAVWIPAGTAHHIRMNGAVAVRTLYFRRRGDAGLPPACRAVSVTPLLRELILEVCRRGTLYLASAEHRRLTGVLRDQIALLPDAPLALPMPCDPRARGLAQCILGHPARPLRDAVERAAASRRTLERLFLSETGMSLGRWQRRARLAAALRLLAQGFSPTRVALEVGYRSPSAFVAAFRATLGATPGRYFA